MDDTTKAEIRQKLGNVSHLRELLLGEQIEKYDHKLEQYEQKINQLESNYQELKVLVDERLEQLESKLIHKIDTTTNSLERKIQHSITTAQEEHNKLKQELDISIQNSYSNVDFLQNTINSQNQSLKSEIIQSRAELEQDLRLLKKQIFEKLESRLSRLSSANVSRHDLAEVLFELCIKLKEPESDLKISERDAQNRLKETAQTPQPTNYILPEQS